MRNRLKIRTNVEEGEIWVRIPTRAAKSNTLIRDVIIDNNQDWKQKHLDIFQSNYGNDYKRITFLKNLYLKDWQKIADFNITFITLCCQFLEIPTKLVLASELEAKGKKSRLVLDICKKLNADELLANNGSRDYLEKDKEIFVKEHIKVTYHNYTHPRYRQSGDVFLEHLSVLDLLFSELENSKHFI